MAAASKGGHCHHHRHSLFVLLMFFLLRRVVVHHHSSSSASRSALFATAFHLHHRDIIITLERCLQPHNNSKVFEFYRTNFHERRNKKHVPSLPQNHDDANNNNNNNNNSDALYTLTSRQGDIVAALRLTKSKNDEQYTFLRSMCVSREHRRQGLASRLLTESLQQFDAHHCYCFASPELDSFYQKAGFTSASSCTETISSTTPKWMVNSFESMANRNQHEELKLYIRHHSPSSSESATTFSENSSRT